ncbi:cyclic pyranopterin monophosphate synthase MoaC [Helicovermis profundi]|uniref:Cyclic pyranopterin monophosphate synthase n=1 Tax=Helicovermis profundi TaxID=3065157 RepID=A0AAU9ETI2_9FIRM|nr:cyclic pyranopterin monophosphate synthase MoaC [Clostridia bacterium S502]
MEFTHFNDFGRAKMVSVEDKENTKRLAVARGNIKVSRDIIEKITNKSMKKGDVLSVAQIAGIMGAKKTSDIIPMCHNIFLTGADLQFIVDEKNSLIIAESTVKTTGKTGVEMEALTAVSIALLTIYDMCKAVDKGMILSEIKLIHKSGGKSGEYNLV